jgi:hypothetical protein
LKFLLQDLGIELNEKIIIHEDNMSTLKVAKNPELHGRTKHIDVKYFFVQELVEKLVFDIVHCSTEKQIADIFTKALGKIAFQRLRTKLNLLTQHGYEHIHEVENTHVESE